MPKHTPHHLSVFRSRCRGARLWVCGPKAPTTVVVATVYNDNLVSGNGTIQCRNTPWMQRSTPNCEKTNPDAWVHTTKDGVRTATQHQGHDGTWHRQVCPGRPAILNSSLRPLGTIGGTTSLSADVDPTLSERTPLAQRTLEPQRGVASATVKIWTLLVK